MASKKKPAQRIPRYVDEDGLYLGIDERDYPKIAWYDPNEGEFGLYLANEHHKTGEETNVAVEVVKEYLEGNGYALPSRGQDFTFSTMKEAREALRLINARLFYWRDNKPFPEWAKKALAEGWSPPKGWKP